MIEGQRVTLRDFKGREIERTLVKDLGHVVTVCKNEEYAAASVENRTPICVGFPKAALVGERMPYTNC